MQFVNSEGLMHGDAKDRNFVDQGPGKGYAAIDLDAAGTIAPAGDGVGVEHLTGQKLTSSGCLPPGQAAIELHRRRCLNNASAATPPPPLVLASVSYDMWCFGVLLYSLCTRYSLFTTDVRERVDDAELAKIVAWSTEEKIQKLGKVDSKRGWPKALLAQLLERDPQNRPGSWDRVIEMLEKMGRKCLVGGGAARDPDILALSIHHLRNVVAVDCPGMLATMIQDHESQGKAFWPGHRHHTPGSSHDMAHGAGDGEKVDERNEDVVRGLRAGTVLWCRPGRPLRSGRRAAQLLVVVPISRHDRNAGRVGRN